ncbi:MAG: hypothetical protein ACRENO_00140 [Thermodesulfobacteriota bacterium]
MRLMKFILLLFLIIPEATFAHGPLMGKGHQEEIKKGPNRGVVIDVNDYYFELLVEDKSDDISLFLLDQNFEVIKMPDDYSGLIRLKLIDGESEWYKFKYSNSASHPYLLAKTGIKNIGSFNALLGLKINGERLNFRFSWKEDKKTNI